jgi:hypothetical protein
LIVKEKLSEAEEDVTDVAEIVGEAFAPEGTDVGG